MRTTHLLEMDRGLWLDRALCRLCRTNLLPLWLQEHYCAPHNVGNSPSAEMVSDEELLTLSHTLDALDIERYDGPRAARLSRLS